jgi:UDP-N-acetylglucosamine 2-epimerase (non-hydrolysing)
LTTRLVDLIAGARPNFMKIAPIIEAMERLPPGTFSRRLVHTGQHYDAAMSRTFFEQLGIPEPDVNLGVGSGTQAEQTAGIMIGYERVLRDRRADVCLVVGDVTSTMACAVVARKMGVPVAHVEAGIRSGDWSMPEEINRVVTDSITNWFFTTTPLAGEQLHKAGVEEANIFLVGNTMIDTLLKQMPRLRRPDFWEPLELRPAGYLLLTLHRPSNVDSDAQLRSVLTALVGGARGLPVVFPVHPRTESRMREAGIKVPGIHYVAPQGYLEFAYLARHARAVITDSGGVTEETTVMGVPCLTLRDTTERPETIEIGTNELIGTDARAIGPALHRLFEGQWKKGSIPELWDGKTAERIVAKLVTLLPAA